MLRTKTLVQWDTEKSTNLASGPWNFLGSFKGRERKVAEYDLPKDNFELKAIE